MDTTKQKRCNWPKDDSLYIQYHDKEWGVPIYEDKKIFEFLLLETFQAGLSWITILRKRENFRKAFNDFDYQKIAKKASKEMAKNAPNKEFRRWEGGVLVLAQDKIYWAFSRREPYHDPSGFGDEAMIVSRVWVNPYTGKIIGSEIRRE